MSYEYSPTTLNPRLLILLTDELEESVRIINRIIDFIIQMNFDGYAPKNRCFISVIGYNQNVKDLCSGWLKDLDSSQFLRKDTLIKKIPDGAGGFVCVEVNQPVWVDSLSTIKNGTTTYLEAIKLANSVATKWSNDYVMAPIVIDVSSIAHFDNSLLEIDKLKKISSKEGNVLFFGCYSNEREVFSLPFSKMPKDWKFLFDKWNINASDYYKGLLKRNNIFDIFSAMMDFGS